MSFAENYQLTKQNSPAILFFYILIGIFDLGPEK